MLFGYARVSTDKQNLERQLKALSDYGVQAEKIYQEKITGTTVDRQQLQELLKRVGKGDTLVVSELSRLGRNLKQLLEVVETLTDKSATFVSLKEDITINDSATGKLMLNMFGAFAQFERDLIAERTREGLAVAKAKGKKLGRPKVDADKLEYAYSLYQSNKYTMKEIVDKTGLKRTSIYNYIKRMDEV